MVMRRGCSMEEEGVVVWRGEVAYCGGEVA